MSDRMLPMSPMPPMELEARLADLAAVLAFPPTPDLAGAVGARLRAAPRPRALPFGGRPGSLFGLNNEGRSLRRSLLLAAALTLLVVAGAFAVRLGLDLLQIRFGPVPTLAPPPSQAATSPGSSPAPSVVLGASLHLGQEVTLDDVLGISSFRVLVPALLGPPDKIYAGGAALRRQIAFVYAPRDGLPLSGLLGGAGLLITQNRGEVDQGLASKLLDARLATVEYVDVNGAPGVWIGGRPHIFWYLAPDGRPIEESRRYVGDTLAWEVDGVLYRIEGDIPLEQALDIAESMR
jgi:hypothetical protein